MHPGRSAREKGPQTSESGGGPGCRAQQPHGGQGRLGRGGGLQGFRNTASTQPPARGPHHAESHPRAPNPNTGPLPTTLYSPTIWSWHERSGYTDGGDRSEVTQPPAASQASEPQAELCDASFYRECGDGPGVPLDFQEQPSCPASSPREAKPLRSRPTHDVRADPRAPPLVGKRNFVSGLCLPGTVRIASTGPRGGRLRAGLQ